MDEEIMSDDSDTPQQHSKLLSAINKLDYTERIKPASRKEPSINVSEFHLAQANKAKGKVSVDVRQLADAIKSPQTLALRRKLGLMKTKQTTLAKPLEKIVADKVKRKAGYEKVKTVLSRWDSVVEHNRVADQLEFPAKGSGVQVHETNIFNSVMNPKTEIEKKVQALLQENGYVPKKLKEPEEDDYPMTLEEVLAQRKEFGDLKRKSIQQQMKTWRQNKIKSKKFHRILRKEKIRQQIKEFEVLKEKNPEEALKRLDAIEKTRAHERASLRHRNTGAWSKNLQIRAKYDKDCRQQLSQQLELSRELSQKIKKPGDESTDEADSEDEGAAPHPDLYVAGEEDPKNVKAGEISDFLSGYRKFWDEKNKNATATIKNGSSTAPLQISTKQVETVESNAEVEEDEELELMEELIELRQTQEQVLKKSKGAARPEDLSDKKKAKKRKSSSGGWLIEEKGKNVIDLFDQLEQKQDKLIQKSINRLKSSAEAITTNGKKEVVVAKPKSKRPKRKARLARLGGDKVKMSDVHIANSESTSAEPQNEPSKEISEKRIDNMEPEEQTPKVVNIDPTKFLKPKALKSMQGEMVVVGGEDLDEERREGMQKEVLAQLFADDDLVEEFRKEKEDLEEKSKPKEVDLTLPGWGDWGGSDMKVSNRKRKKFILKPKVELPRKDRNLENVIINETCDTGIGQHQVSDLPFPFRSVKEFEASIRAPIGRTWVPETAHRQLSAPKIVTHAGQKIEPMTEEALVQTQDLLINKKKKFRSAK